MNTPRTFRALVVGTICASAAILVATPEVVAAQTPPTLPAGLQNMMMQAITKAESRRATVTPMVGTVDEKTHQATFTLENLSDDTLDVGLSVRTVIPNEAKEGKYKNASALPADSLSKIFAADSTHSLVAWVTGLPQSVVLPPHGKQPLAVTVNVPAGVTPGEYSGWVVATSTARVGQQANAMITLNDENGKPYKPMDGGKIVYKVK